MESLSEPSATIPGPVRHSSISTIGSEKCSPMPVGEWTFQIHGNCPRCRHHHKGATMRIKVLNDQAEASHVRCERCHEKWLTFGARNSTQISLLSTTTTDLDIEEVDFRQTLVQIVRSAAAIASPTALASVPEAISRVPSRGPSRGNSVRAPLQEAVPRTAEATSQGGMTNDAGDSIRPTNIETATISPQHQTTVQKEHPSRMKHGKKVLNDLQNRLKRTLSAVKKGHLHKFVKSSNKSGMSEKAEGKLPFIGQAQAQHQDLPTSVPQRSETEEGLHQEYTSPEETADVRMSKLGKGLKNFDKEAIREMTPEQRILWLRDQISHFKCASSHASCGYNRSTTSLMVDSSTQVQLLPPFHVHPRRHSHDGLLEGLGSHFDLFPPGTMFSHTGPLSISATRTSEAETVVEPPLPTTSPRHSWVDVVNRHRHRSTSPPPASLANSRHSWQHLRQHSPVPRASLDSIVTAGATRGTSRAGRRGTDRRSIVTLVPTTIPSRSDSPDGESRPNESNSNEDDAPPAGQAPSSASTPRPDVDITDAELHAESTATPSRNPPRTVP